MVFENLFSRDTGVLRPSGTILVTHALHFLPRVDFILAMSKGSPSFCGSWAEFQQSHRGKSKDIRKEFQMSNSDLKEEETSAELPEGMLHKEGVLEKEGMIMTVEERKHGRSSLRVWVEWFKNAGGWCFFLVQFVLLIFDRGVYVASDW